MLIEVQGLDVQVAAMIKQSGVWRNVRNTKSVCWTNSNCTGVLKGRKGEHQGFKFLDEGMVRDQRVNVMALETFYVLSATFFV